MLDKSYLNLNALFPAALYVGQILLLVSGRIFVGVVHVLNAVLHFEVYIIAVLQFTERVRSLLQVAQIGFGLEKLFGHHIESVGHGDGQIGHFGLEIVYC